MALRAVPDHPKFADLKQRLGVSRYVALGALEALWHFAGRFTPKGNVGKYSDQQIESWIEWTGTPGAMIEALVCSRWIDRDSVHRLIIHDWEFHADKATKQALKRSNLQFCVPTVHTPGAHNSFLKPLPVPEPVPVPEPEPEPEPPQAALRALTDPKPKSMQSEAPVDFVEWWELWSAVRGTSRLNAALQTWLSIVNGSGKAAIECTRSYLDSLDNPAKGFNPDRFLSDQAAEGFQARWAVNGKRKKEWFE